ncbi:MAG: hypothetical protein ACI86M_003167 [Saprospiraceae bacterium]
MSGGKVCKIYCTLGEIVHHRKRFITIDYAALKPLENIIPIEPCAIFITHKAPQKGSTILEQPLYKIIYQSHKIAILTKSFLVM